MKTALLVGDSITGGLENWGQRGYARLVREELIGTWTISTLPENGGDSRHVLANLDTWLDIQQVDVIHMNCGLHDLRRHPESRELQVSLEEYGENLRHIVTTLRRRHATLIWARITPVRDDQHNESRYFLRFNADVEAFNATADSVMTAAGVPITNLYAPLTEAGVELCIAEDGVHLTPFGADLLCRKVIDALQNMGSVLQTSPSEDHQADK